MILQTSRTKPWPTKAPVVFSAVLFAVGLTFLLREFGAHQWPPTPSGAGYHYVGDWRLPPAQTQWPDDVLAMDAAFYSQELYVLAGSPPRVVVMAPEGGEYRSFGEDVLSAPADVAVVYPAGAQVAYNDPYGLNPSDVKVFVTEPSLDRIHVFASTGVHERLVTEIGEPTALMGIPGAVLVTAGRAVLRLGLDGRVQQVFYQADASRRLGRIEAHVNYLTETVVQVFVTDTAAGSILLLAPDGGLVREQTLTPRGADIVVSDIAFVAWNRLLYVATDQGLRVVREAEPGWHSVDLPTGLHAPAVLVGIPRGVSHPSIFYTAPRLILGPQDSGSFQVVLPYKDGRRFSRLILGCPMVDTPSVTPWRVVRGHDGSVYVAYSNGTVYEVSPAGTKQVRVLGDLDDLAVNDQGEFYFIRSGFLYLSDRGHLVRTDRGNPEIRWQTSPICTPPHLIPAPSMATTSDSRALVWVDLGDSPTMRGSPVHGSVIVAFERDVGGDPVRFAKTSSRSVSSNKEFEWITDVAISPDSRRVFAVNRLRGQVASYDASLEDETVAANVPGRPMRLALGEAGTMFVLTAEGYMWRFSGTGNLLNGWDAAGAPNGARADLVDLAVDASGRVLALDRREPRLLVFEPGENGTAPAPELPPPCSVEADKDASEDIVPIGQPVTVTLTVRGSCGRRSSENDILLLLPHGSSRWLQEVYRVAPALFDSLDWNKNRVGILHGDSDVPLLGFTSDAEAVRRAWEQALSLPGGLYELDELFERTRAYFAAHARPGVNQIAILFASAYVGATGFYPHRDLLAAQDLRNAGIRMFVLSEVPGVLVSAIAYMPEDAFATPDPETIRAVFSQIGRDLGARVLARQMTVSDEVPTAMDFVEGSPRPAATWDPTSRTLRWEADGISFAGWEASYQLVPKSLGRHPTNERADATYIDGFGHRGALTFPVPWVNVIAPPPTPTPTVTPTDTPTVPPTASSTPTQVALSVYLPVTIREQCVPEQQRVDVVLVIDASTSMLDPTSARRSKLTAAREAAQIFIDKLKLNEGDQAAVVAFNQAAWIAQELTSDRDALESALADIQVARESCLVCAVNVAAKELTGPRRITGNTPVLILLTDGRSNPRPASEAVQRAWQAKADGIVIFTIGLGDELDLEALEQMASTQSYFYRTPDAEHLNEIYTEIAVELPCPADQYWGKRP